MQQCQKKSKKKREGKKETKKQAKERMKEKKSKILNLEKKQDLLTIFGTQTAVEGWRVLDWMVRYGWATNINNLKIRQKSQKTRSVYKDLKKKYWKNS